MRLRVLSTFVSSVLAIAAACLPLSVYESLERELGRWSGRGDTIQIAILRAGTREAARNTIQSRVDGLTLFQPPFLEHSTTDTRSLSQPLPTFTFDHITSIRGLPHVAVVAWERFGLPFVTATHQFDILRVPAEYFDLTGRTIVEGRPLLPGDPNGAVVLGSEAKQLLFGSGPAVGQTLTSDLWGEREALTVVGVLAPVGTAYGPLAARIDRWFYRLDAGITDASRPASILSLWVRPTRGHAVEAMREIQEFATSALGEGAELQLTTTREFLSDFGAVTARQVFLGRFAWAVVLALGVAALNIGTAMQSLILQRRYEYGTRRSVGASRFAVMAEALPGAALFGLAAGALALALGIPISTWLGEAMQFCWWSCPIVPIAPGPLTVLTALGLGMAVWLVGTQVPLGLLLRYPPADLLRARRLPAGSHRWGWATSGAGFASGVTALIVTLGLRDGVIAQSDRILGWSGGERAGAFVGWNTDETEPGTQVASVKADDYRALQGQFPQITFGWLDHNSGIPELDVLTASATMAHLRPPSLLAGRWFTEAEQHDRAPLAILGPALAHQTAAERSVPVETLVGQPWRTYTVAGVMDDWPGLRSMGYYPHVAYIPVGVRVDAAYIPQGGQLAFLVPPGMELEPVVEEMRDTLRARHPGREPQLVMPIEAVRDLLTWRTRLHALLGLFAAMSLLIGGVGVMNQVFVWTVSRWRQIGIRRAVGARRIDLIQLILGQTSWVTITSAILGGTVGTIAAVLVQKLNDWPIVLHPAWFLAALGVALAAAALFGGLPAYWAATQPPAEMLRQE